MNPTLAERRAAFRALHEQGCFVLPNPWDVGSARLLESLGFKALATTSSGHAWSLGQADGARSRGATLAHMREIVEATALPVNADFESGFADSPDGVAESVRMAIATGVAGLSIEDSTGDSNASAARPRRCGRSGCARRAPRSTRPAATSCWSAAPRTSSSAGPTSTTRCGA